MLKEKEFLDKKELIQINSISSYLAMFPVSVPLDLIKKYSTENDLIMDNFSGRGTTAISSRFLNRRFVGNDLNPYSYVLSKFKISKLCKNRIFLKLRKLEREYENIKDEISTNGFEEMLIYYSEYTLKQLIFLRNRIGKQWKTNGKYINAILAFALGLMHGPERKNGETIYFSVSMSNMISMSPNYVENYKQKHNLKTKEINIFKKLKNRIETKFFDLLTKEYNSSFKYHDSLKPLNFVKDNSVNLVITSPPYLSIVDYTKSNWIKLWLLGYDRKNVSKEIKLKDKLKMNEYIEFIKSYLNNIYPKLKTGSKVCLVVGDVYNTNLIEETWQEIKEEVNYEKIDLIIQEVSENKKSLRSMNSKKGKATQVEKILILKKE
ncbi:DNA methyltransferase [Mesomycoplasma molare]|uniref:Methyltransferase n=1 Tax=Mesomycoplasma molare TaxID=171288 RepID=A0ABY5TV07_9BACT|nr:DNA methyltransferase [Mesomycoplasma molare]UWD34498.1 site-specific DNA-methyltransferase [Mesomycoplasma molare]